MLKTIRRAVRKGVATTSYPDEPYVPCDGTLGAPALDPARCTRLVACQRACPTAAITVDPKRLTIDLSRCIFCGACARACPNGAMAMSKDFELSSRSRGGTVRTYEFR